MRLPPLPAAAASPVVFPCLLAMLQPRHHPRAALTKSSCRTVSLPRALQCVVVYHSSSPSLPGSSPAHRHISSFVTVHLRNTTLAVEPKLQSRQLHEHQAHTVERYKDRQRSGNI